MQLQMEILFIKLKLPPLSQIKLSVTPIIPQLKYFKQNTCFSIIRETGSTATQNAASTQMIFDS